MAGLSDLRVLEVCGGVAGGYCGKLFADAGADVIKLEPPDGEALRNDAPPGASGSGALFAYLNTSKRSVLLDRLDELAPTSDVLIEDRPIGWLEEHDLIARFPHLVVVSITPFGRGGPDSARPGPELIIQAEAGAISCRGRPDMDPIHAGGRISAYTIGAHAAPPAIAAALQARRTSRGRHIDVSGIEVMNIACTTFADLSSSMRGRPPTDDRVARSVEAPSIEPAADGWIGFNTNTGEQFQNFCLLIERPDLIDSDWKTISERVARLDEFNEIVHAWTREHTVAEILERAAALRIPCAAVGAAKELVGHEQLVAREMFVPNPSMGFDQPRQPYFLDGVVVRPLEPVPTPGQHDGAIEPRSLPLSGANGDDEASDEDLPLAGVRVVDFTSWWAGPASTAVLAQLGADVIHVESTTHPDGMRLTGAMFQTADWWEWGHMFLAVNYNKRDVTLDLNDAAGLDLARRLISSADVIVENFSPRVMERFGLDHAGVHATNPTAVYARMPAFGLSGPWRERVGFAQTMEQMSGMAWVTGHEHDQPRIMRGPCDPIAGMHGAVSILAALAQRDATGAGVAVEATMVEAALNAAPEIVIDSSAYGVQHERAGNRGPYAAPQGVYRCNGDADDWLAVAVTSDQQWQDLCAVMEATDLAGRFPTDAERRAGHDDIDAILGTWAGGRSARYAASTLQAVGVPAAELADPRNAVDHRQFAARRFLEMMDHPVIGAHPVPAAPFSMTGVDRWVRTPTPTLGEHNHDVLTELGLTTIEIDDLESRGVIGHRPFGL